MTQFCHQSSLFVGYFKVSGQVIHTIENTNAPVTGIVVLNDRMYVSHWTGKIAVYCPTTFQNQQFLNFTCRSCRNTSGMLTRTCQHCATVRRQYVHQYYVHVSMPIQQLCMVGCDVNNCLYASDQQSCIYKVAINTNDTVSSWSVDGGNIAQGLSITSSHNLLAALSGADALHEYSTDGNLIRQISCEPAGISSPVHVVQLSNDHYAVTHHDLKANFH